ncbi:hypothetical protein J4229_00840 [Candidatus Pacearchaeota archaeon]|nr:hypothetical protein [Candidatus Pacearchaeota archaeon]
MKLPEEFESYVKKGVVKRVSQSKPRAKFLIKEAEFSLEGLKERIKVIEINDKNSNSIIKDCYDILMELIRAKLLLDGYFASGSYAHKAEISYLKLLRFPEEEISFLNELSYFRNGVLYYGTILDKEYAEKVVSFMNKLYPRLRRMVD